jgi:large subunit ribosomal protein L10
MVNETVERYRSTGCMVAVAYEGLSGEDSAALRKRLRDDDVDLRVVKNRIARIAMRELGRDGFGGLLEGQTAVIACDDPVGASKAAVEYTKARKLELKGGWLEGRTVSTEEVRRLATIPPRNVLMGQIAGLVVAPLTKLAGMVQAPYASIARALKAWNEAREGGEKREGPEES